MYNEKQLIDGLKNRSQDVINYLYADNMPKALGLIGKYNGTEEDAKNVFHDALLALTENVIQGKFSGDSKVNTYLLGITKLMWFRELKRKKIHFEEFYDETSKIEIEVTEKEDLQSELASRLKQNMKQLDEACKSLLIGFYYEKTPLVDLASDLGYTSQFVRIKKARCLNKLKGLMQNKV